MNDKINSLYVEKDRLSYFMSILFACTGSIKLVCGYFLLSSNPVVGIVLMVAGIISYGFSTVYFCLYEGYIE